MLLFFHFHSLINSYAAIYPKAKMLENMVAADDKRWFHQDKKVDFHLSHLLNIFLLIHPINPQVFPILQKYLPARVIR